MQTPGPLELTRDCEAVHIPAGHSLILPAGTPVHITQTLGGSYTVHAPDGLFRIAGKDADALGLEQTTTPSENGPPPSHDALATEEMIWEALRSCYDPEIPVNIVDLGLVYEMQIEPLPSGNRRVSVKMTLTAPGCGMGGVIAGDAQQRLLELPGVQEAEVDVVWDPPWHPSMISPSARAKLGME